jgi:glycosyltransferase involved in cell wall biosynthesis
VKKDILLLTLKYPGLGGIERSFEILEGHLSKAGHDVKIVALESDENSGNQNISSYKYKLFHNLLILEPYKTYCAFKAYIVDRKDYIEESVIISRHLPISYALAKADIAHTFIPPCVSKDFYNGVIASINKNEKGIFRYLKLVKWFLIKKIYRKYEKFVLLNPKVRICTFSNNVKNNLLLANGISREIEVCYPGIEHKHFHCIEKVDTLSLIAELGIQDCDFVVLYVGRLFAGKNVDVLIETFRMLDIKNKKLVLVGSGSYGFEYDENILAVGKKDIDELKYFYNMANVLVLPTISEGFGQVLVESLGCGTPVAGFDSPNNAIDEIVTDELFGQKTDELTSLGLSDAIYKIYLNKEIYDSSRRTIETEIKRKFSWDLFVKKVLV